MFRFIWWKGVCGFIGVSLLVASHANPYNKAELDAAERGLNGRKMMTDFISLYKGDPGQLANRKDLLYISYELVRRLEKGEESIKSQLNLIDQKITRLRASGTGAPNIMKEIETLNQKLVVINDRVMRLSAEGTGGKTSTVASPDVKREVRTLVPPLIDKSPRIQKIEREIAALKKNQKPEDRRRGSDKALNSQVHTARLIAGTSIAVTLFTVLFMAR